MIKLEEDKIKECKVIFDMFDKDKDTKITTLELGDCLRVCGAAPAQQDVDNIIKNLESNGNNLITFEKFLALFSKLLEKQDSEEDIIKEFEKMDKKGNGTITETDLRNLLSNYEGALSPEEVDDILSEANVDENGYIDIKKFTKVLLGKN